MNEILKIPAGIQEVTDQLQKAKKNQLVFYRINEGDQCMQAFRERLPGSEYGLLVVNRPVDGVRDCVCVADFLAAQKQCLDKFYPLPAQMKLAAVTGTNGKTTIVNLAMQVSTLLGRPAISIGTIGVRDAAGELPTHYSTTTPSFIELRKILHAHGGKYAAVFLEATSHALVQGRLFGLNFDVAAWTNLTQDHLDFHKDMQDYFLAKCLLPQKYLKKNAPLFLPSTQNELMVKLKGMGTFAPAAPQLQKGEVPAFFQAGFNQDNLELALAMNAWLWKLPTDGISLSLLNPPDGRFATMEFEGRLAIVDYAHTPDAIHNIASSVKKAFPMRKLHILFGCGGDRDAGKRPLMGQAAAQYADVLHVTSDNPRFEDPDKIIDDITPGLKGVAFHREKDRRQAILKALKGLNSGDILLILGKGHEKYQDIKGVKHPFSDFDVVREFMQR